VLAPATATRAERAKFRQDVTAQAIVADVASAVVQALARGDALWDDD
jgi:hypothetical protein